VGVKVTLMVQLAPEATEPAQVFVWAKSPLAAIVSGVRAPLPVLVSVSVCGALVVETVCAAKLNAVADRLTTGPSPVPLSVTVCVLPVRLLLLSVTVRVPVRVPGAVGMKATLIVQELLALTLLPQVFVWEKSPLTVMLEMASGRLPVLDRVKA
jgi:hypothetical protein